MEVLKQKLTALLEQGVEAGEIAGANILVLQNDQELLYTQAGWADREARRPYSRDTIVRLYSMTKPVTAAGAMLLVQRGQLDLGMALGDILPAFRDTPVWEDGKAVPARRSILVKDLLNMTSGLAYPSLDSAGKASARLFEEIEAALYGDNPLTTREIADRMAAGPLAFHPGDRWMYGTSADVLGAVIEAVSGESLADFMKQNFFEPLGMKDTAFWVPGEKQSRLAQVYERAPQGMARCVTNNLGICYTMHREPAFASGGAGLVSTIDDYARFATMLLSGGGEILRPSMAAALEAGCLTPWQRESCQRSWESMQGCTYGNLMRHMQEPGAAVHYGWEGEYGWDGWLGAYFCNSPKNGVTILMTTQLRDSGTMPITRKMRNLIGAYL